MKSPSCGDKARLSIVRHMRFCLPILFLLAACADIPALDASLSEAARAAPYPRLMPLGEAPVPVAAEDSATEARVAALQSRAEALRGITPGALQ